MRHEFDPPASAGAARWAVIVAGGDPLADGAAEQVPPGSYVIAADSGFDHAHAAGIRPDLLVGDLDSISVAGVAWAREHHVPIEVYPTDKDLTDTQLALGAAISRQLDHVLLLGGGGDRLDHTIAALTALGHPSLGTCKDVRAIWGAARVHVLHAPGYWEFELAADTTFSLLALHGECTRVTLTGAHWPLTDATIEPASSLGISNVVARPAEAADAVDATDAGQRPSAEPGRLRLSIGSGVLTLLIPHHLVPVHPTSPHPIGVPS